MMKFERWELDLICDALESQANDEWGDGDDAAAQLLAKIEEHLQELVA